MIIEKLEAGHDRLDRAVMRLYDLVLFILARLILVDITFTEAKDRKRSWRPYHPLPKRVSPSQAQFHYDQGQEASKHTDEKVKQLLTLSVALNAFLVAFARGIRPQFLVVAAPLA